MSVPARSSELVVGHTRWKAAQRLGLEKIPVHEAAYLTPEQARAYRLADNRLNQLSEWDPDLLPLELAELKALDIDLSALGWSEAELSELLAPACNEGLTDPDAVPEPPDDPVTKPGDLWVLGEHRLLCGDSASESDVDRLLEGKPVHLVNTDPPYNVRVEPRSNNAIAAGLSSFSAPEKKHHQKFDLARHPEKAQPTHRKMRAKDRPLTGGHFGRTARPGRIGGLIRSLARGGAANSDAGSSTGSTPSLGERGAHRTPPRKLPQLGEKLASLAIRKPRR